MGHGRHRAPTRNTCGYTCRHATPVSTAGQGDGMASLGAVGRVARRRRPSPIRGRDRPVARVRVFPGRSCFPVFRVLFAARFPRGPGRFFYTNRKTLKSSLRGPCTHVCTDRPKQPMGLARDLHDTRAALPPRYSNACLQPSPTHLSPSHGKSQPPTNKRNQAPVMRLHHSLRRRLAALMRSCLRAWSSAAC